MRCISVRIMGKEKILFHLLDTNFAKICHWLPLKANKLGELWAKRERDAFCFRQTIFKKLQQNRIFEGGPLKMLAEQTQILQRNSLDGGQNLTSTMNSCQSCDSPSSPTTLIGCRSLGKGVAVAMTGRSQAKQTIVMTTEWRHVLSVIWQKIRQ